MSLSDPIDYQLVKDGSLATLPVTIANSETVYLRGYYARNTSGYLTELADSADLMPLGIIGEFGDGCAANSGAVPEEVTGNTSAAIPPIAIMSVDGFTGRAIPVAGASTLAHVGRLVYCGSDAWNTDCTLTPTTYLPAIGIIVRYYSATSFDVRFFSLLEMKARQAATGSSNIIGPILVKHLNAPILEAVTSANIGTFPSPVAGRISRTFWAPSSYEAGIATGTPTISFRTVGGAVSGGVLTVSGGRLNAVGDMTNFVTGTAITNTGGGATVSKGELITLVRGGGAGITAIATGNVGIDIYMSFEAN